MLKISVGSGKMAGMGSINTNSKSNSFCQKMAQTNAVCKNCYSNRLLSFRKRTRESFEKNSELLSKPLDYFDIPKIHYKYFRFHSFGELINSTHLLNFLTIANANKHVQFALWTKRKDFIKKHHSLIPNNMILVYSNPVLDKVVTKIPKYFDKVFNVVTDKKRTDINCGGKQCVTCLKCYKKSSVKENNVIIENKK